MPLDPSFPAPESESDALPGAFGEAVRAAARGAISVSDEETERALHALQARIATHEAGVIGTIDATTLRRRRPQWLRFAAAAVLTVGAVGVWQRLSPARDVVTAPLGKRVAVTLPDGSTLTLAAGSTASWVRGFRGGTRDIALEGEAFFDVVHDDAHPFRVHAGAGVAEDVGTRFLVRGWPELAHVDVVVAEGIVALSDSAAARSTPVGQQTQLQRGQRGQLGRDGRVAVLPGDSAAFSWLTGTLAFADVPATEAIAVIGRWYGVSIAVDSALAERRLTARFVSQPLPQLLDALALALSAKVDRRGSQITLTP